MQGGKKKSDPILHKLSVLLSQYLIAGARIPRTLTSDRNYPVSPGTNHSSKHSSYRLARGGSPSPDVPPAAGWCPVPAQPTPDTEFPGARPVALLRPPRAGARCRRQRRCTCPGRRLRAPATPPRARAVPGRPARWAPSGPQPPAARPSRRRPRAAVCGEEEKEGGPRAAEEPGLGHGGRGGAHLGGRGSGGHLVSLQRRARFLGPETPRHQPAGSSRHSPDKHLPGASGAGGGGGRRGPAHGEGTQLGQKSGERPAAAPPGSAPRGAPARRLPASAATARPPEALAARPRRPRPLGPRQYQGLRPSPQPARWLFGSRRPHLTSPERAAEKRRGVGGLSRRR